MEKKDIWERKTRRKEKMESRENKEGLEIEKDNIRKRLKMKKRGRKTRKSEYKKKIEN